MFKNIVVGLSGGVDSAVTAFLLKQKGFNVTAVFLRNWDTADETGRCFADEDLKHADYVCKKLNLPLVEVNFIKEYWNDVFSYFLNSYQNGMTPNPDIMCNKMIKFNLFFNYARNTLNADAIATGHYVKTSFGSYLEDYKPNTKVKLFRGRDHWKDQSFFLSQVPQEPLQRSMFPLATYKKKQVKRIAAEAGLEKIAHKEESMGICFIGNRSFSKFISEYLEDKPGNFIDYDTGNIVGQHRGLHYWTLGQRSGLAVGNIKAYYIYKKVLDTNDILVVQGNDHPALFSQIAITSQPHWICEEPAELVDSRGVLNCMFMFQHIHKLMPCQVYKTPSERLIIKLQQPMRAITPGQFAVLYLNEECLGSAPIISPGPSIRSLNKSLFEFGDNVVTFDYDQTNINKNAKNDENSDNNDVAMENR